MLAIPLGRSLAAAGIVLLLGQTVLAQDKPALREIDRVRLAEAFTIGETLGNRVWKDWSKAPFAVLLVTPDHEFLIRHPKPSPDFIAVGHDSLLKSDIYVRKRTQSPDLLATFPAVTGSMVSTIVIGQAENTVKKTSSPWVITLLHEHFHQLQNSQPSYYADVDALQLSKGDQSGMWMLNFHFPYEKAEVKRQFEIMSRRLAQLLEISDKSVLKVKLPEYLADRKKLETMLDPDDYKYLSFQVWQEGIARYTEYRIAELAAKHYKPSKAFRALSDFKRFGDVADDIRTGIQIELSTLELDRYERVAFYSLGAAEGLLLDRLKPRWQSRYFGEKFYVDRYF